MSEHKKLLTAVVASALLHLLAVTALMVVPRSATESVPSQPGKERTLEVTLVRRPAPAAPTPTPKRPLISSEGLNASSQPPAQATFESDKDMRAASEQPPTGNLPLPSQEGKERRSPEFESKQYALGKLNEPGGRPSAASPKPAEPKAEPAKPRELSSDLVPIRKPGSAQTTPAKAAPPQQPQTQSLQTPAAEPSNRTGYQRQSEKTRIQGSISNRGRNAVDAASTPLGRYRKSVADAIGSRWYYYVNQRMDLITVGVVHIKFQIDREGRVQNLKILSNSSNETFANYCVQSVTEAKVPRIPPDLVAMLEDGRLEIQYTFTIYPQ